MTIFERWGRTLHLDIKKQKTRPTRCARRERTCYMTSIVKCNYLSFLEFLRRPNANNAPKPASNVAHSVVFVS